MCGRYTLKTKVYDQTSETIMLDEVERIAL